MAGNDPTTVAAPGLGTDGGKDVPNGQVALVFRYNSQHFPSHSSNNSHNNKDSRAQKEHSKHPFSRMAALRILYWIQSKICPNK